MTLDPTRPALPLEWKAADGVRLVGDGFGSPSAPPVIFLHGGGQTRHAWGSAAQAVAKAGHFAATVDLRGHGDSAWSEDGHYGLDWFSRDVGLIAKSFDRPCVFVGASLGGLASLLAEGESDSPAMRALLLVDVAPRLEPEGVMRVVSFMLDRSREGFESLEEAAQSVATFLPHRPKPRNLSGLEKNLRRGDDGRYRWHWDPRFLSGDSSVSTRDFRTRLESASARVSVPTLLIRGRLSDVLSEEGAQELLSLIPHAQYVDVRDAGHMIAGDKNDAFNQAVLEFLSALP